MAISNHLKNTLATATGQWHNILKVAGIPSEFLTNKHGPCILCGGKDRYRFDNKEGRGTYFCNQCGAGDGLDLLQKFTRWPIKNAIEFINSFLQITPGPKGVMSFALPIAEQVPTSGEGQLKEKAKALEAEVQRHKRIAVNAPANHRYLISKGIHIRNLKSVGDYLIIPIYVENFRLISYQRIWPDGTKYFLKGTIKDGVYGIVGRYMEGQPIIISESFSTSFAIYASIQIACWISFGHQGFRGALRSILSHFVHGGRVIIACDGDASEISIRSALKAVEALEDHHLKNINIVMPDLIDTDFCDLYLARGTEAVRDHFKELLP